MEIPAVLVIVLVFQVTQGEDVSNWNSEFDSLMVDFRENGLLEKDKVQDFVDESGSMTGITVRSPKTLDRKGDILVRKSSGSDEDVYEGDFYFRVFEFDVDNLTLGNDSGPAVFRVGDHAVGVKAGVSGENIKFYKLDFTRLDEVDITSDNPDISKQEAREFFLTKFKPFFLNLLRYESIQLVFSLWFNVTWSL